MKINDLKSTGLSFHGLLNALHENPGCSLAIAVLSVVFLLVMAIEKVAQEMLVIS